MAQLFDARGNEFAGTLDTIGGQTFTDARTSFGTLGALNAELVMDIQGKAVAMFDIRTAAGALSIVFEGTVDGTNYYALPGFAQSQNLAGTLIQEAFVNTIVVATTTSGIYEVGCTGFRRIRARVSAYTSGNVVVAGRATAADFIIYSRPIPSTLAVTATAAANTGYTLTLPAVAGLFHYITRITSMRNATAALAGTATLTTTTTNLPGAMAWSVGNAMSAGGTAVDIEEEMGPSPLKSSVAGTATTIVVPAAGAAVLTRTNVFYYLGA
jgi:hypothetical protein